MIESNVVVVERFIRADPDRIYRALTVAEEMERWFFSSVTTDPRVGGEYRMQWRSAQDATRDHERFGTYTRLIPNELVEFEWHGVRKAQAGSLPPTLVTITLTPQPGGTLLRLVHSGWPTDDDGVGLCNGHDMGWTFYVENLEACLAGGPDRRAEQFGQLVGSH